LLEEAFAKAKRDLNAINLLTKEANPAQLEKNVYYLCTIEFRQEKLNHSL
jgi:hypothetical protein